MCSLGAGAATMAVVRFYCPGLCLEKLINANHLVCLCKIV